MSSESSLMNKRRVSSVEPSERLQLSIRLSKEAGRLIQAIRQPNVLADDGCAKGDVAEIALRDLAEAYNVPARLGKIRKQAIPKE